MQSFEQIFKNVTIKWGSYKILLSVAVTSVCPFSVSVFLLWLSLLKFRSEMTDMYPLQNSFLVSLGSLLCCSLQWLPSTVAAHFSPFCCANPSGIKREKRKNQVYFSSAKLSIQPHYTAQLCVDFWRIRAISKGNYRKSFIVRRLCILIR